MNIIPILQRNSVHREKHIKAYLSRYKIATYHFTNRDPCCAVCPSRNFHIIYMYTYFYFFIYRTRLVCNINPHVNVNLCSLLSIRSSLFLIFAKLNFKMDSIAVLINIYFNFSKKTIFSMFISQMNVFFYGSHIQTLSQICFWCIHIFIFSLDI